MVAVSYAACEYGRGDVTELTVVCGTQKLGHCTLSLVYCHSPKIMPELVPKPATLFRSMLNRDTFSRKHNVKMESLVLEICFGLKEVIRTKNLQKKKKLNCDKPVTFEELALGIVGRSCGSSSTLSNKYK